MALVMVMLYDLQDRKFQPREPMTGEGEGLVEEVKLVEDSLFRFMQNYSEMFIICLWFFPPKYTWCVCVHMLVLGLSLQPHWLASESSRIWCVSMTFCQKVWRKSTRENTIYPSVPGSTHSRAGTHTHTHLLLVFNVLTGNEQTFMVSIICPNTL